MNKIKMAAAAAFALMFVGLATPALANTQPMGCVYQGEVLSDGDVTDFIRQYNAMRVQNGYPVPETAGQLAEYVVAGMVVTPQYRDGIPEQCRNEELMKAAMLRLNSWQPQVPIEQLTGTVMLPTNVTYTAPATPAPTVQEAPNPSTIDPPEAELLEEQAAAETEMEIVRAEQAAVTAEIANLRQQVRSQAEHGHAPNPAVLNRLAALERQNQAFDERLTTLDELVSQKADRSYVDGTFARTGSVYTREEVDNKFSELSLGLPWWAWLIIGLIGLLAGIAFLRTFGLSKSLDDKADVSSIPDVSKKADKTAVEDVERNLTQLGEKVEDLSEQVGVKSVALVGAWKGAAQSLKTGEAKTIQIEVDGDKYEVGLIGTDTQNEVFITSGLQGQPETNAVKVEHLRRILRKAAYQDRLTEKVS